MPASTSSQGSYRSHGSQHSYNNHNWGHQGHYGHQGHQGRQHQGQHGGGGHGGGGGRGRRNSVVSTASSQSYRSDSSSRGIQKPKQTTTPPTARQVGSGNTYIADHLPKGLGDTICTIRYDVAADKLPDPEKLERFGYVRKVKLVMYKDKGQVIITAPTERMARKVIVDLGGSEEASNAAQKIVKQTPEDIAEAKRLHKAEKNRLKKKRKRDELKAAETASDASQSDQTRVASAASKSSVAVTSKSGDGTTTSKSSSKDSGKEKAVAASSASVASSAAASRPAPAAAPAASSSKTPEPPAKRPRLPSPPRSISSYAASTLSLDDSSSSSDDSDSDSDDDSSAKRNKRMTTALPSSLSSTASSRISLTNLSADASDSGLLQKIGRTFSVQMAHVKTFAKCHRLKKVQEVLQQDSTVIALYVSRDEPRAQIISRSSSSRRFKKGQHLTFLEPGKLQDSEAALHLDNINRDLLLSKIVFDRLGNTRRGAEVLFELNEKMKDKLYAKEREIAELKAQIAELKSKK